MGSIGFWKRQARTWHWISGAICLTAMLLFAATGITLNHAREIEAKPTVVERTAILPIDVRKALEDQPTTGTTVRLPHAVSHYLKRELSVSTQNRPAEWTDVDVYVGLPRPGGDAWLSIDRETGAVFYESSHRGAIAYLNDLHKGRNTGQVWSWFIDIFSVCTVLFCLTGLWLLQIHAPRRRLTWPLTITGLAIPAIIAVVFIH